MSTHITAKMQIEHGINISVLLKKVNLREAGLDGCTPRRESRLYTTHQNPSHWCARGVHEHKDWTDGPGPF